MVKRYKVTGDNFFERESEDGKFVLAADYDALVKDRDEWRDNCKHRFADNIELKKKYDALLALARRLRVASRNLWFNEDDTDFNKVMDDSAWLED